MGLTARDLMQILEDTLDEYPDWDPPVLVNGISITDVEIDDVVELLVESDE